MTPPIRNRDLRALLEAVESLYAIDESPSFAARAISSVNHILDGDMTVYTELDPKRGIAELIPDSGGEELARVQEAFRLFQHQHPAIEQGLNGKTHGVDVISELCSVEEWHNRDFYQEVFAKLNLEDQLVVSAPMKTPKALGITVSRSTRGFTDREQAVLRIYGRHFVQAFFIDQSLRQAHERASLTTHAATSSGWSIVQADSEGHILNATQDGRTLLTHFFPERRRKVDRLPSQLVASIRELHPSNIDSLKKPHRITFKQGDRALQVEVSGARRITDGFILLLLEVAQPRALSTHEQLASTLPPRLRRVLDELLTGDSEKRIAGCLSLSKNTVHEYVTLVYRHFEVRSRSELMALWVQR